MAPRAAKATAPADMNERPPDRSQAETDGHNMSDREKRAAARLRHANAIRLAMDRRVAAQDTVKALRKQETLLRNAYKHDGFSLALLDEAFDRENTPNRDLVAYEAERVELFEDLGQTVYVEQDMLERMPEAAFDETVWRDDGYKKGVDGRHFATPPKECPPEFHQAWLKGWGAGQEKLAWALEDRGVRSMTPGKGGPTADEISRQPEPEFEDV